jgi:O-antigen ligase
VILADIVNNTDIGFALGLVMMILGIVVLFMTGLQNVAGWAITVGGLAMVLVWWPQ